MNNLKSFEAFKTDFMDKEEKDEVKPNLKKGAKENKTLKKSRKQYMHDKMKGNMHK